MFQALQGVTFTVRQGQVLGIIGRNGSGKSTLLKLLAGIYRPDRGTIHVCGRVGALLELGAGFHPEFSGRENVLINGIVLGLSKRAVRQRFDAIVRFAEIEAFIDEPVKTYSLGMYMRLGFAVAVHARNGYPYDYHHQLYSFTVKSELRDVGVFRIPHRWVVTPLLSVPQ
jgi:lipopolysaccharide transport system ATP-binding protein